MNKEREIAEAIWNDMKHRAGFVFGALEFDEPNLFETIINAHCEIIHRHLASTAEVPQPAPQSESEAVRLLRELRDATIEAYPTLPAILPGGLPRMNDVFWKVRLFLQRPSGPDWRTLAVDAFTSWQSDALSSSTVHYMHELHDAALAADKGGSNEVR